METQAPMLPNGVYIGPDSEWIAAGGHLLAFRRIREENCLESCRLVPEGGAFVCAAVCRSYPLRTLPNERPRYWKYAYRGRHKSYTNDRALANLLGRPVLRVQGSGDNPVFVCGDGHEYAAQPDELFTLEDLSPLTPAATADNLAQCLRTWQMGCYEETTQEEGDTFTAVTINTARHMAYFQMAPSGFYCRSARYATCTQGVLFAQNFRQRRGPSPETYMIRDNATARRPLTVGEEEIARLTCAAVSPEELALRILDDRQRRVLGHRYGVMGWEKLSQRQAALRMGLSPSTLSRIARQAEHTLLGHMPGGDGQGIFWAVSSFTPDRILLHGCQGDEYTWERPQRE